MNRRKNAFLVNLWIEGEDDAGESNDWRGSIEHLTTRERLYFSEIAELVDFLASWTGRRRSE